MSCAYLLADGSILHGQPLMQHLLEHPSAVALYDALGDDAKQIGPWLLDVEALPDWAQQPLPLCLGLSLLTAEGTSADVANHLRGLTTVQTDDDQRFYLRFADTRVLQAMRVAWPESLIARVKGRLLSWQWTDRFGVSQQLGHELPGVATGLPVLGLREFEALISAGEPDRMAQMLDELRDDRIQAGNDNVHYQWMLQALTWCDDHGADHWSTRRAAACQAILSEGRALLRPGLAEWLMRMPADADPAGTLFPCPSA